jgi:diphthamide biosynthesis protein 3
MSIYDEIEIEDMTYDETLQIYHYPCPCGDRFEIGIADLQDGEDIAVCPSCSLMIKVIFEVVRNICMQGIAHRKWLIPYACIG